MKGEQPRPTRKKRPAKDNLAASSCFLALLRGINVGGRNIIRMADLKSCFEDVGCLDVVTFIQSGNVVFRSEVSRAASLVEELELALSARFAYESRVVVLTHPQLTEVVDRAPAGFGNRPGQHKYDVIFVRKPLTASGAMKCLSLKEGVDAVHKGNRVLYYTRRAARLTQSHLPRIVTLPAYQSMTIRNWNTTTRLLAIMNASVPGNPK